MYSLHLEKNAQLFFPDPYFPPGKGPHIASVPGLVMYYHIYINGCMSSAKEFLERYRGMWRDNCMWVICWQASSWDADYVRITAKMLQLVLPLNFGRMISGPLKLFQGRGSMHRNGNLPL